MMPNITRGDRMAGLLGYLVGQSSREAHHANAHTNPHVAAGHDVIVHAAPTGELSMDDALDIANLLDQPRRVFGTRVTVPVKEWDETTQREVKVGERDAHVWHASLSIKADEGQLSDAQWGAIARDFVNGMGFVDPDGAGSCRWVAIRHGMSEHGNDHVHIAVSLVREDGSKARVHNDYQRAQALANELEHKYGLQVLESREETVGAQRGVKPAELERARRDGDRLTHRDELRRRLRAASAGAGSEVQFLEQCRQHRVLVRPRFAKGDTARVVGYSAAIVPDVVGGVRQAPVWFAASKLDTNMGLGQLRQRWQSDAQVEGDAVRFWKKRSKSVDAQVADMPASVRRMSTAEIRALNEKHGQNVIPDFTAAPRQLSPAEASALYARLSVHYERAVGGPFAEMSDSLAREPRGNVPVTAPASDAGYEARLMNRATSSNPMTGFTALFRQMGRTADAVAEARRLRGAVVAAQADTERLQRANAMAEELLGSFRQAAAAQRSVPQPVQPSVERPRGRDTGQSHSR